MSNQEILERAIKKAIDGGMKEAGTLLPFRVFQKNEVGTYVCQTANGEWCNLECIIFNHEFAKALWGRGGNPHEYYPPKKWQYHLQQMVIADDPIKYLGENI